MKPTPMEYLMDNWIAMVVVLVTVALAVIGVCAIVSEIRYRIDRRRYQSTHL